MKESVGGISLFNIVIVFVLVFTGYVSLSINYSKAYNIKNEILSIIRNQGGVCTASSPGESNICYNFAEQISDYFKDTGYRAKGNCKVEDGWVGYTREGELKTDGKNVAFCVKGIKAQSNSELPNALYYQVEVFYQLDLPIIYRAFRFTVKGETSRIYAPNECEPGNVYPWCK